jgi:hypothetical protein
MLVKKVAIGIYEWTISIHVETVVVVLTTAGEPVLSWLRFVTWFSLTFLWIDLGLGWWARRCTWGGSCSARVSMLLRSLVFISLWLNFKIFLILLPLIWLIVWFTCRIWILHVCATSSARATVACLHKLWVLIGDGPYPDRLLTCLQRWEILSLVWLWLLGSILLLLVVVLSLPATATIWASRLTVWAVLLFIAGGGDIWLLKAASLLLLTFCIYFAHWWCYWRALNLLKIFYN